MKSKTIATNKWLSLVLVILLASSSIFAQKSDSILIHYNVLRSMVWKDTIQHQKQVTIAFDTIYNEVEIPRDYDLYLWREYAKDILPTDSIQYNADFDFTGKRLIISPTFELVFFAPNRLAEVRYRYSYDSTELIREGFLTYHPWKEVSVDSLNLIAIYERNYRNEENETIACKGFIIPLKDGKYRTSYGISSNLRPSTYTAADIPSQRQLQDDTDTVNINGK